MDWGKKNWYSNGHEINFSFQNTGGFWDSVRDFKFSDLIDIIGSYILTMQGLLIVALWLRSEGWMAVWDGALNDVMSVLSSELEFTSVVSNLQSRVFQWTVSRLSFNMSLNRVWTFFYFPTAMETWLLLLCLKEQPFLFSYVDPLWRTTTLTWKLLWDMVIWAFLLICRRQRQGTLDFSLATHTAPWFFRWD